MGGLFAFTGHETMGAYVQRKLESIGWQRTDDVARCGVAFTYCMGASLLEDAYFDEGGLVKNAAPGTLLVDLSPSTPSFAREVSAVAAVNDLAFVEAPLVVTNPLEAPEFTCYVASEEPDALDEARPLLGAIAVSLEETERIGSAQLAKALDTVRKTAVLVGAVEAAALERSARGGLSSAKADGNGEDDDFTGGFPAELLMADVVAAMAAADDVDLILPQLEASMHLLELLVVIGGGELAPSALSLLYREEAASTEHGLDWTRAESLYAEAAPDRGIDYDFDERFDDDFGSAGGFGGYSSN